MPTLDIEIDNQSKLPTRYLVEIALRRNLRRVHCRDARSSALVADSTYSLTYSGDLSFGVGTGSKQIPKAAMLFGVVAANEIPDNRKNLFPYGVELGNNGDHNERLRLSLPVPDGTPVNPRFSAGARTGALIYYPAMGIRAYTATLPGFDNLDELVYRAVRESAPWKDFVKSCEAHNLQVERVLEENHKAKAKLLKEHCGPLLTPILHNASIYINAPSASYEQVCHHAFLQELESP